MTKIVPLKEPTSPEQRAFTAWAEKGKGNCVVEAVAGSGKSTTVRWAAARMPGQVAVIYYNKPAQMESKEVLEAAGISWKKVQVGTAHSFGFSAFRKQFPNVKVDDNKLYDLLQQGIEDYSRLSAYRSTIERLVNQGKQAGLGLKGFDGINNRAAWDRIVDHFDIMDDVNDREQGSDEPVTQYDIVSAAMLYMQKSISNTAVIDFADMIYMPLFHRCRFWQFDVVIMDEAQDTNNIRRAMMKVMCKAGGRVIAVGDRHQAIYGFTGADNDSLDLIKREFGCIEMSLSVSFRCSQEVVKFAQQWVSHIQPAPTASKGSVTTETNDTFLARKDLTAGDAMLSRTTAPLVSTAFALIRKRVPCKIEGREIGNGLKKLVTRWKSAKTITQLEDRLTNWLDKQTERLQGKKNEAKLAIVQDQADTVRVICDQCKEEKRTMVQEVVEYIDGLFDDKVRSVFVLCSIHKSKGREWNRVFWLDRAGTCPSKWATQEWAKQQEVNLMYVAATRSKDQLIEVLGKPAEDKAIGGK